MIDEYSLLRRRIWETQQLITNLIHNPTHHQSTEPEPVPSPADCPPVAEGD